MQVKLPRIVGKFCQRIFSRGFLRETKLGFDWLTGRVPANGAE